MAVETTASEATAASKAATAAHEDRAPLEELVLVEDLSGGAETMDELDFTALPAFGVVARVRVLPATAPGVCRASPWVAARPSWSHVQIHSKSCAHVLAAVD